MKNFLFSFLCIVPMTLIGQGTYCVSNASNSTCQSFIAGIELPGDNGTGINNPNDCDDSNPAFNGYDDFTHLSTNLSIGNNYEGTITLTDNGGAGEATFSIYVDWNGNFTFDDPGELIFTLEVSGSPFLGITDFPFPVIPPPTAQTGPTRMRVLYQLLETGPCNEASGWGETEDYTIIIGEFPENPTYVEPVSDAMLCLSDSLFFDWDAPAAGVAPEGYKFSFGADTTNFQIDNIDLGNVTDFTLRQDYVADQKYYWRVTAYAADGDALNPVIDSFTILPDVVEQVIYPNQTVCLNQVIQFDPTLVLNDPAANLSFEWQPATALDNNTLQQPTFDANLAGVGDVTYTLFVTDVDNGCIDSTVSTITVIDGGNNPTITSPLTVCLSDLPLTLTADIPNGQYSGTGVSGDQFAPTMPGMYDVTYSINTGNCDLSVTETIEVLDIPVVTASLTGSGGGSGTTFCPSDIGRIGVVSATGEEFIYTILGVGDDPIDTSVDPAEVDMSQLEGGDYVLSVRTIDANGCVSEESTVGFSVLETEVEILPTVPLCNNATTIQLKAIPEGGTWNGPGIIDPVNGIFDPNAIAGPDTVQVRYEVENGICTGIDSLEIEILAVPTPNAGLDAFVCRGEEFTLGGAPSGQGGTGDLTYIWRPLSGLDNANSANPVASTQVDQVYSLTVEDANGCRATDDVQITVPSAVPTVDAGLDQVSCSGSAVIIGADPTAFGGLGTLSYDWSPQTNISAPDVPNPSVNPSESTVYTVTVTDASGCSYQDSVLVDVQTAPEITAGNDTLICEGTEISLGGTPTAIGGKAPYVYDWNPKAANLRNPTTANPLASPSSPTEYVVTVVDENGCIATDRVFVDVTTNVLVDAGEDDLICRNTEYRLGGLPTASGGTPPFTYQWEGNSITGDPSTSNPNISIDTIEVYAVTVMDAAGCVNSDTVVISVLPDPDVDAGGVAVICEGQSITLGGNPAATGGSGSFSYEWQPSQGLSNSLLPRPTVTPESATQYTLTVTDGAGCVGRDSILVKLIREPGINFSGVSREYCADEQATDLLPMPLGGTFTGSGVVQGNTDLRYAWQSTNGSIPDNGLYTANIQVAANQGDNILGEDIWLSRVYVDIAHERIGDVQLSLVLPDGFRVPLMTSPGSAENELGCPRADMQACFVATGTNLIQVNTACDPRGLAIEGNYVAEYDLRLLNNGIRGANGIWRIEVRDTKTGDVGELERALIEFGVPAQFDPQQSGVGPELLTYTYSDCFGCDFIKTQNVVVNTKPIVNAGPDKETCQGANIFIGQLPIATGGNGTYNIEWSPCDGISPCNVARPQVLNPRESRTYTVRVESGGCVGVEDEVEVVVTPSAEIDFQSNRYGPNLQYEFLNRIEGGTSPYDFNWNFEPGAFSNSPNPIYQFNSAGVYTVSLTVTDGDGCVSQISKPVDVKPAVGAEQINPEELTIYPNPVKNGILSIEYSGLLSENILIRIYDSKGTQMITPIQLLDNNSQQIDISSLPKGIYFIQIGGYSRSILVE